MITGIMSQIYPPAILGHDEQELLKNSGHPAAAWVHDVRVINAPTPEDPYAAKLQAKMGDAPASVSRLINRRAYRKTSAEIYDEPPDGCKGVPGVQGKVLRAVAFLGREIPRVKRLEDIPQFNEKTGTSTDWVDIFATGEYDGIKYTRRDLDDMGRNYKLLCKAGVDPAKFSEQRKAQGACRRVFMDAPAPTGVNAMDELRQKLIQAGMPEDVVKAMDDTALQAFAQACAKFATATPSTNGDGTDGVQDNDKDALKDGMNGNTDDNDVSMNDDTTEVDPNKDTDKMEMPPNGGAAAGATNNAEGGPAMVNPSQGKKITANQYSEIVNLVMRELQKTGTTAEALQARAREIDQQTRKRLFSEKVTDLVKRGVITPAVNEGDLIVGIALDLGSTARKFGDSNLSLEQRFGILLDRLGEMKPIKLGERAPSGDADARKFSDAERNGEKEAVRSHYRRYSDRFAKAGTTEETYVKSYEILQKERGMTAEEYTGVRD